MNVWYDSGNYLLLYSFIVLYANCSHNFHHFLFLLFLFRCWFQWFSIPRGRNSTFTPGLRTRLKPSRSRLCRSKGFLQQHNVCSSKASLWLSGRSWAFTTSGKTRPWNCSTCPVLSITARLSSRFFPWMVSDLFRNWFLISELILFPTWFIELFCSFVFVGVRFPLAVRPSDTIDYVKERILMKEGIHPRVQHLTTPSGTVLYGKNTVAQSKIEPHDELLLISSVG